MRKISSSSGGNGLLVRFLIKALLFTILSVLFLSYLFSFAFARLDIDLKYLEYCSYVITAVSAIVVSYLSVKSFKNNGFLMGIISISFLIIFSFINMMINGNDVLSFFIKIVIMIVLSGFFGFIATKKRKKYKAK